jgi:4-aminobutyrate aminotransferase-like enzyme
VAAGANEVLAVIEEEGMLENARSMGTHAVDKLRGIRSGLIKEVRGIGLMLAVELVPDFAAKIETAGRAPSLFVVDRLHEAGLLTVPAGSHAFRWLPPLNIAEAQIDEAAGIVAGVFRRVAG